MPSERYIWIEGSYNLSGDYTNGRADLMLVPDRKTFLTINNGYLKLEDNNYEYLKRDNKDVPDPLEPTYDGSQGGGDDPNGGIQGGDNSDANLVAWYTRSEIYNSKEYIIAVVLLDDGTVAFTSTPVVNESGMLATTTIMGVGTYTITDGDLTSGTIVIVMYGEPQEFIAINGVVTAREGGVEMTYTKQDNSAYDGPTDFSHEGDGDDGDDDGDDDDNGQGSGYIGDLDPYFPAQYAEKTVAAWYANLDMDENKCKIQSIFLFTDNSLVSTISKFYSTNDGRDPEYKIEGEGRYEITSGDYEDGTAKVTLSDGRAFEATIIDGDLIANESVFSKQNNADLPAPRKVQ
jgi:hypothetical protein